MKHIDMRSGWIQELRDTSKCLVEKIVGEENLADSFTKLLPLGAFKDEKNRRMPHIV